LRRATFSRAAETKKVATGLEMGQNFFSLRCVAPLSYQGEAIGFLEVAEEVDHVFERMKAINENDASLFLTEEYLSDYPVDFPTEQVDGFTVLYPTDRNVSLQLASRHSALLKEGLEKFIVAIVELDGKKYAVGAGPFQDAFGETAGVLFSHREISP